MKKLIIAAWLLATAGTANASKEGALMLSSFHLETDGIATSGKIVIDGKQDKKGELVALQINAFGRDFVVPREKLIRAAAPSANSVRITYEAGTSKTGGRTVHLQLQMGFIRSTKKEALVTLTESGSIEVSEIKSKKGN